MKVYAYPADSGACALLRITAPAETLRRQGHDVTVVPQEQRQLLVNMNTGGQVLSVAYPADADVMVFQRTTHKHLLGVLRYLRDHTPVATVLDIDDDLSAVHPANPAWAALHPRSGSDHSWNHLLAAARIVNMVVVSSPALLARYAPDGRGRVIHNYLPDSYYGLPHQDSDEIGWPASLHSHPDDPATTRGAIGRLVREGARFRVFGDPLGVGRVFGLESDPPSSGTVSLEEWPAAVAALGIGIAPLADTRFSLSKSWLKPLELSAVGVPWVASPRAEYLALHKLGAGLMAKKPQDWYRQLRRLLDSPAMRQELSEAGRAVAGRLRLKDWAYLHAEAWEDALALQRGRVATSA
jgi:hypothetical protein